MIMICGIPNAGKTTYSKQYDNVVHLDEISGSTHKRHDICREIVSKGDVVIEGVFGTKRFRRELISLCPQNVRKTCIWLDTPVDECLRREQAYRKRPNSIVLLHAKAFEEPTYDEGWDEIIRIKSNP